MTSKSSSLANPVTIQKQLCTRRLWLIALLSVYSFLAGPVLAAILLAASRAQMMRSLTISLEELSPERYYAYMQRDFLGAYGLVSPLAIGTFVWAVLIGLTVFAYLNDGKKLDFYEAQPMKRSKRFVHMFVNGLVIFAGISFLQMLLVQLTAVLFKAMTAALFMEVFLGWVRQLIFFLSTYSIVTLGAMVSGNLVIGFFASMFLFLLEPAAFMVRLIYRDHFLPTYVPGYDKFLGLTSPVYQYATGWSLVRKIKEENSASYLLQKIGLLSPSDGKMLLIAAVAIALTYVAYRHRRTEHAGSAIIFPVVRLIVKVSLGVMAGLFAGIGVYYIVNGGRSFASTVLWITMIILFAILVCIILEAIYQLNVKATFRHFWHAVIAVVIALVIYGFYDTGALGYDSYVPDAAQLESGALVRESGRYIMVHNDFVNMADYSYENMFLEDTEALCEILRSGAAHRVELNAMDEEMRGNPDEAMQERYNYLSGECIQAKILLRFKNGRTMVRDIVIPQEIEDDTMNRLIGTDAYKEVAFRTAYTPYETLMKEMGDDGRAYLKFSGMLQERQLDESLLEELLATYKKDLEHYNYTLIKNNIPLGQVSVDFSHTHGWVSLPVYEAYTKTIALLEREGVLFDAKEIASHLNYVTVSQRHWYGNDVEDVPELPEELSAFQEFVTEPGLIEIERKYTDPNEKEALVRMAVSHNEADGVWISRSSKVYRYDMDVSCDGDEPEYDIGVGYYTIVTDKMPDFLAKDFIIK